MVVKTVVNDNYTYLAVHGTLVTSNVLQTNAMKYFGTIHNKETVYVT